MVAWIHEWTCDYCGGTFDYHPFFALGNHPCCSPSCQRNFNARGLRRDDAEDLNEYADEIEAAKAEAAR